MEISDTGPVKETHAHQQRRVAHELLRRHLDELAWGNGDEKETRAWALRYARALILEDT